VLEAPEVIIPHAPVVLVATNVRSTLLQSSLATIKAIGRFERYVSLLDPLHRETILESLAPGWLPIQVACAHYHACDQLALSAEETMRVGELVGDRIQGTFLTTLTKVARGAGVTPWLLLKRFDRLWSRLFEGGSVQLTKTGPKDMALEIRSAILPRYEYFRVGFCGVVRAGFKFVGVRASYVKIEQWASGSDRLILRAAWV
jgi:hypothetical protein